LVCIRAVCLELGAQVPRAAYVPLTLGVMEKGASSPSVLTLPLREREREREREEEEEGSSMILVK